MVFSVKCFCFICANKPLLFWQLAERSNFRFSFQVFASTKINLRHKLRQEGNWLVNAMASTSESVPDATLASALAGRLFYCHRCTHQWRKLEESVRFVNHCW